MKIKIPDNTQVSAKLRSLAEKYKFDVSHLAAGMCYASLMQSAPDDSHNANEPVTANSDTSSTSAAAHPTLGLFADTDDADIDIPALSRPE